MRVGRPAGRYDLKKWATVVGVVFSASVSAANPVVGGFNTVRAGAASFVDGSFFEQARAACQNAFPGTTFASTATLTPEFLSTVDVVVLSAIAGNHDTLSPLSATERQALHAFVLAGGALLELLDNQDFENTGLESPFGLHCSGALADLSTSVVVYTGSPLAAGPYGIVTHFSQAWAGFFDAVPGQASVVAVNGLGASLASINGGTLGAVSGPCVFYTDNQTFVDDEEIPGAAFSSHTALFLNTLWYLLPEKTVGVENRAWTQVKSRYRSK